MLLNYTLKTVVQQVYKKLTKYPFACTRFISSDHLNSQYKVHVIPALQDNYMYVLSDRVKNLAVVVDPVEPEKIVKCLEKENLILKAVLTTHHHFDHAGGNSLLLEKITGIPVFGGDDRIEALTNKLSHNQSFQVDEIKIRCLHTPCHTSGHVCYFIESNQPICFTGDTLFVGGCGRFFEGSAEQMYKSLNILSQLPMDTKIYCGHEYTVNNLKFALFVEPQNSAIKTKLKMAEEALIRMEPTVPSTIKDELSFNPFLRAHEKSVQNFTHQTNPAAVIKTLRDLKDNFKG